MSKGTRWFRRLRKECEKISPLLRFKRIKYGFYRIYYQQAYIGECSKDMTEIGYDIEEKNYHFEDNSYRQEYEDLMETTARVKNFREGYWDNLDRIRTRVYMFKSNKEFYDNAINGYKQMRIK
jgi:hypothetical protein